MDLLEMTNKDQHDQYKSTLNLLKKFVESNQRKRISLLSNIESEVETKISFSHWDLTEPASISSERKTWSEIKATTLFQADP